MNAKQVQNADDEAPTGYENYDLPEDYKDYKERRPFGRRNRFNKDMTDSLTRFGMIACSVGFVIVLVVVIALFTGKSD